MLESLAFPSVKVAGGGDPVGTEASRVFSTCTPDGSPFAAAPVQASLTEPLGHGPSGWFGVSFELLSVGILLS